MKSPARRPHARRPLARRVAVPLAAALLLALAPLGARVDAAPGAAPAGPGADAERPSFPKRRPGLWEIRSTSSQATGLEPTQHCVGEHTDVAASHLDRQPGGRGACTLGAFRRAGDAWLAESVCREGRSVVTSRAVATGDFETEYRIDTLVTYDPPLGGIRREDKDAIVARWLGPCAPKQKPGDMVVPGMGTLNLVDGTFRAEEPRQAGGARRDAGGHTRNKRGQP